MRNELRAIGFCEPTGAMTTGYTITRYRQEPHTVVESWPSAPENSSPVATYYAIGCGLKAYVGLGGAGPMTVRATDPQVIQQIQAASPPRHPLLARLRQRVQVYLDQITVQFVYDPAITVSGLTLPNTMPVPGERRIVRDPELLLDPALEAAIRTLNWESRPNARTLAGLRVGGPDMLSEMRLDRLQWRIVLAAREQAPEIVAWVARALPSAQQQAAALRWVLRGLAVEIAVRKVQADLEVRRSGERRSLSGTVAAAS